MRDHDEDPEVVADLQLRAHTERDRSRASKEPVYVPPVYVDTWACKLCRLPIEVTADAVERVEIFNRALADRREPLLITSELVACLECAIKIQERHAFKARRDAELLGKVIARLKLSRSPEHERGLIAELRQLGHPDVDGLVESLRHKKPTRSAP